MATTNSTMVKNDSRERIQIGTFIYRGNKEINVEAIRKNTLKVIDIVQDRENFDFILQIENQYDNKVLQVRLRELFSSNSEFGDLLFFADNFDEIIKLLSKVDNIQPTIPTTAVPANLLKKADEIIHKLEAVDLIIGELRKESKLKEIKRSFRSLLEEACALFNQYSDYKSGIWPSTYDTYKKRLKKCNYDRSSLARTFGRDRANQIEADKTTECFLQTMILNYIAGDENRLSAEWVYSKIIPEVLKRTDNQWVDPKKCDSKVPPDLVEELLNPKIPIPNILNNSEKSSLLSNFHLPCRTSFYNYARWYKANPEQSEKEIRDRFGDEFYESFILTFDSFVKLATYPLLYVFADHCLLDIFIVDDETRSEPFKVWLTVLIDAFSRCILGIALLDHEPSIKSIQSALKNAIFPKEDWLRANDLIVTKPWACFGYPVILSCDNAWAHHSHSVENLLLKLSFDGYYGKIKLEFHPPYMGRRGALIERFFGNIQSRIRQLLLGAYKGREFKSIANAKREACLLYSDLLQAIVTLITDYHHTRHSELGATPMEKWMDGMKNRPYKGPKQSDEIDRFFWREHDRTRVINKDGIHIFGMPYWSPALDKAQRVDWDKKNVEYSVSFDIDDISTIAVFRGNKWVFDAKSQKLRIGREKWLKLSLAEFNLAKKISEDKYQTPDRFLECLYDFHELNERRTKEKDAAKRKGRTRKGRASPSVLPPQAEGQQASNTPANQAKVEFSQKIANFIKNSKRQ